jgi:hypothetical protein
METERADLARFLIQSPDAGSDKDAEAAWDAELERRAGEIKNSNESASQPIRYSLSFAQSIREAVVINPLQVERFRPLASNSRLEYSQT